MRSGKFDLNNEAETRMTWVIVKIRTELTRSWESMVVLQDLVAKNRGAAVVRKPRLSCARELFLTDVLSHQLGRLNCSLFRGGGLSREDEITKGIEERETCSRSLDLSTVFEDPERNTHRTRSRPIEAHTCSALRS